MRIQTKALIIASSMLVYACNQGDNLKSKIDKSSLTMLREMPPVNYQFIELRCNCPSENYLIRLQSEQGFSNKASNISLYFQDVLNGDKPKPSFNFADSRVRQYLDSVRNDSDYQTLSNKAAFAIIQGYFLQETSLTDVQKASLGYYLDLLVEKQNANLPELAKSLEKLEGYWTQQKVRATAEQILSNYQLYNEDDFLDISKLDSLKVPSDMEPHLSDLKSIALQDALAKDKLLLIIARNQ